MFMLWPSLPGIGSGDLNAHLSPQMVTYRLSSPSLLELKKKEGGGKEREKTEEEA